MPRMSPDTQRKIGLSKQQVDFDEFLQEKKGSTRYHQLKKALGVKEGSKKARHTGKSADGSKYYFD